MERTAPPEPRPSDGARLAAQERFLRLALAHLAGGAVRRRIEVDDLVQEVFLRALAAPGGLPPAEAGEGALRRFLLHLARHAVIDAVRAIRAAKRDGREERLALSAESRGARASQIAAAGMGPATGAAAAEECARIHAAFDRLSPEHRRVLGLRQVEGLSARDAARRMGKSETAVHSLYRRALAAWEEALGARDPGIRGESPPARRPPPP
ncbi:MAG: RNA polymerase sigma factor [Planctomycetota bacterium]